MLNLDPNFKISIQSGKKLQKYCEKNDSLEYLSKMSYLLPNNLFLVSVKLQIRHTDKLHHAEKKTQNNLFHRGQEHCENAIEIYKYFLFIS